MYKFVVAILFAGILGSACAAPPAIRGKYSSLNWVNTNIVHNPFGSSSAKSIVLIPQPNFLPTNVEEWEPPVFQKPMAITPATSWISLDAWARQHHLGKPRLVSNLPVTTYSLTSSRGVMDLAIGSHAATWNGIEIHLGFAPQVIDGEVYLYGLDLQKNLKPLLCDPPLLQVQLNPVVVIDPGHGGRNTGTHSVLDGRFEKEFTLDWAKRLAPLLRQEGWRVFLTHTNDVDDSLSNRVAFADAHHADLFISLHFNSTAPNTTPSGIETYCLTPTGMPSTLTRGYADPWSSHFPNNEFDAQNLQLAVRLQSALVHATGMEDHGICRARFMGVLQNQQRPAVLIEAGFLSHPADARLIETPKFRQKLAQAIADALKPNSGGENAQTNAMSPQPVHE